MSKSTRRRAFTLPEVLVTVTVVAVLAAVVVPAVTQYAKRGDAPATSQDINQIRTAVTSYISDTRAYPDKLARLITNASVAGWAGPYTGMVLHASDSTFTTSGYSLTLGPTISTSPSGHSGYLTTAVTLPANTTCARLWEIDRVLDGGSTSNDATGSQGTDASRGNLQWTGGCLDPHATTGSNQVFSGTITLRIAAIGSGL